MESLPATIVKVVIEMLVPFITMFSPFRIIRKIFFKTPLLEEPEGEPKLLVLWICDILSWIIVMAWFVVLFHAVFVA